MLARAGFMLAPSALDRQPRYDGKTLDEPPKHSSRRRNPIGWAAGPSECFAQTRGAECLHAPVREGDASPTVMDTFSPTSESVRAEFQNSVRDPDSASEISVAGEKHLRIVVI